MPRIFIGTAGWSIPRLWAPRFPGDGTHLQRCARVLSCAEINSSFYRPHAAATYAKWAAAVPDGFQFSVKAPRAITHDERLRRARQPLERFLAETAGLGAKRGPLLVQLPPSLAFERRPATLFFDLLRQRYDGPVVCEPRHDTWLSPAATTLLIRNHVARVAADPPRHAGFDRPGGWSGLIYFRLHGSPRTYWSRYTDDYIVALACAIRDTADAVDTWCVFDNTAAGAAIENACDLRTRLADAGL